MRGVKSNIMPRLSPFIAIYISCLTEFGTIYLAMFNTLFSSKDRCIILDDFLFLTGSIGGRILTSIVSYRNFLVLNSVQTGLFSFDCSSIIARLKTDGSSHPYIVFDVYAIFVHGFIVTEVFQCVSDNKTMSSWAGLSNQAGALSGSLITFTIVKWVCSKCKH